jgi:hypothetical protein
MDQRVLIVNLNAHPSIVNLPIDYFKKEGVISVFAPKKDSRNLEKNNSPRERCPDMTGVAVPSLKGRLRKWNRLAFTPSSDFVWEEGRSSLKTSSMER